VPLFILGLIGVRVCGSTLAAAVNLAGARDGTAYFDNPNTPAYSGGDNAELKPPPVDEIGRMQISEEKLCVPIVVGLCTLNQVDP
jgi:hypothetical protein